MPSFNLRSKLLLLVCAPLLVYIFSLWGCLEFWIVPRAIEKLAEDRANTVSKSVDKYIQAYFDQPEYILQANKNAIDLFPISKFLGELESSNNNQNQIFYAKIFIIDSCGGIIATSNKYKPQPRQDNSQIISENNNIKCDRELSNIKYSEQYLIKEIVENQQFLLQRKNQATEIKTENIVGKVIRLNYSPQQNWLAIIAIPRESIGKEITPWIVVAKFLCILLAIIVGIIFWFFVACPIINSIKSLTKATEEIEKKDYELPSLKDANDQGDELGGLVQKFQQMAREISDREQIMEQKLEQQQLERKSDLSIKQELEQLKQETDIQKKAERVIQIIESQELQQLINNKKIKISNQLKKNG